LDRRIVTASRNRSLASRLARTIDSARFSGTSHGLARLRGRGVRRRRNRSTSQFRLSRQQNHGRRGSCAQGAPRSIGAFVEPLRRVAEQIRPTVGKMAERAGIRNHGAFLEARHGRTAGPGWFGQLSAKSFRVGSPKGYTRARGATSRAQPAPIGLPP